MADKQLIDGKKLVDDITASFEKQITSVKNLATVVNEYANTFNKLPSQQKQFVENVNASNTALKKEQENIQNNLKTYTQLKIKKEKLNEVTQQSTTRMNEASNASSSWFSNMSGGLKNILHLFGIYSAAMIAHRAIMGTIGIGSKLSDDLAQLAIYLDNSKQSADDVFESLTKIKTRTSLSELLGLAEIVAKKGVIKEEISGIVTSLDSLFLVLGDSLGSKEEATASIVKLISIFNKDGAVTADRVKEIGASLQYLTTNGVATGKYLISFTERLGAMRSVTGQSQSEILGLGAAFEQLGIKAEVSANSTGQIITKLFTDIPKYAKMAGIPVAEFKYLLENSSTTALIRFAKGLKDNSVDLEAFAKGITNAKLQGVRVKTVLAELAINSELFTEKVKGAAQATDELGNNAESAALKQETFAATIANIKKEFEKLVSSKDAQNFFSDIAVGMYKLTKSVLSIPFSVIVSGLITWTTYKLLLNKSIIANSLAQGVNNLHSVKTILYNNLARTGILGRSRAEAVSTGTILAKIAALETQLAVQLNQLAVETSVILALEEETIARGGATEAEIAQILASNARITALGLEIAATEAAIVANKSMTSSLAATGWGAIAIAIGLAVYWLWEWSKVTTKTIQQTIDENKVLVDRNVEFRKSNENIENLVKRYKNLNEMTNRSKEMDEELLKITGELAKIFPTTIDGLTKEGVARGLNAKRLEEEIKLKIELFNLDNKTEREKVLSNRQQILREKEKYEAIEKGQEVYINGIGKVIKTEQGYEIERRKNGEKILGAGPGVYKEIIFYTKATEKELQKLIASKVKLNDQDNTTLQQYKDLLGLRAKTEEKKETPFNPDYNGEGDEKPKKQKERIELDYSEVKSIHELKKARLELELQRAGLESVINNEEASDKIRIKAREDLSKMTLDIIKEQYEYEKNLSQSKYADDLVEATKKYNTNKKNGYNDIKNEQEFIKAKLDIDNKFYNESETAQTELVKKTEDLWIKDADFIYKLRMDTFNKERKVREQTEKEVFELNKNINEQERDKLKKIIDNDKETLAVRQKAFERLQALAIKQTDLDYFSKLHALPTATTDAEIALREAQINTITDAWTNQVQAIKGLKSSIKEAREELEKYLTSLGSGKVGQVLDEIGFSSIKFFTDLTASGQFAFIEMWKSIQLTEDKTKRSLQEMAFAFQAVGDVFQDIQNNMSKSSDKRLADEINNLTAQRDTAIRFAGDNAAAQDEINRQFNAKKHEEEVKAFEQKKKLAKSNIIIDLAQAVISLYAKENWVTATILGAILTGAAIYQISQVNAQQPPSYRVGRDGGIEEYAITQDGGQEIITDAKGNIKDFGDNSGGRLTHLKAGDKVLKHSKTMDLINFNNDLNNMLLSSNISLPKIEVNTNVVEFERVGREIVDAIVNKPETTWQFENGDWKKHIKQGHITTVNENNRVNFIGKSV